MEIDSLTSYVKEIAALRKEYINPEIPIFGELLFRGHSNIKYQLLPSLARGRTTSCDVTIFNGERNLIELAKCKYPDIFRDDLKPVELLALLQHYGIPTRLLDVTENSLVALYFACFGQPDTDGEVFVFFNKNSHVGNAPVINAIADTYRLTREAPYSLEHFFNAAVNQSYFAEHKHIFEICNDKINHRVCDRTQLSFMKSITRERTNFCISIENVAFFRFLSFCAQYPMVRVIARLNPPDICRILSRNEIISTSSTDIDPIE